MAAPFPDDPSLAAALHYATHGLRVVPVKPGTQHPVFSDWPQLATTDPAIITSWWTGLYRGHGVSIVTGRDSRIWVLDIDVADNKPGAASLADLEATYAPLPPTVEAISGRGGRHLLFAWDDQHPVRNNQSGRIGPGIDVRGEGGQIVAAPSIHPKNGQPYRIRPGHDLDDLPIAAAPGWLYALLETEPNPPRPIGPAASSSYFDDDDSAAAAFNATTTWTQLLQRDGWTLASDRGYQKWTRPGKDTRDGCSATVGYQGRDVLKVFTSSVAELQADGAYSRFGYEAAVHHGGDRSAFARFLRRQMNTNNRSVEDWSWVSTEAAPFTHHDPDDDGDVWADPEPLGTELTAGIPFPLHTLPDWIRQHVQAVSASLQVPVDMPAMLALGALSVITMGHLNVNVTGSRWREPTNLYLVVAMPPGAGKSPAVKAMTNCLKTLQTELIEASATTISEAELQRSILEKRAKAAQDAASLPGKGQDSMNQALKARAELEALVVPTKPRLLAEDITPESLVILLGEHDGRIAVVSSEGGVFDMMAGQYADRQKTANLAVYLQGWSGDTITQDRVGRAPINIETALLSICVTTQPAVLSRLAENPALAGRGLPARFMYSVPPSNVGARDRYAILDDTATATQATYDRTIIDLGRQLRRYTHHSDLQTSLTARDLFLAWDQTIEHRCGPGRDLAHMAEWISKLRASVLRLAGLLHLAEGCPENAQIGEDTMGRALAIGAYWIDHAARVHDVWQVDSDPNITRAHLLLQWIVNEEITEFSFRDGHQQLRNHQRNLKSDEAVPFFKWMISAGWLRAGSDFERSAGKKGAKSPMLLTHPNVDDFYPSRPSTSDSTLQPEGREGCEIKTYLSDYYLSTTSISPSEYAPPFSHPSRPSTDLTVEPHQSPPPTVVDDNNEEQDPLWPIV